VWNPPLGIIFMDSCREKFIDRVIIAQVNMRLFREEPLPTTTTSGSVKKATRIFLMFLIHQKSGLPLFALHLDCRDLLLQERYVVS
jgi:hypothetical protein